MIKKIINKVNPYITCNITKRNNCIYVDLDFSYYFFDFDESQFSSEEIDLATYQEHEKFTNLAYQDEQKIVSMIRQQTPYDVYILQSILNNQQGNGCQDYQSHLLLKENIKHV